MGDRLGIAIICWHWG